MIVVVFLLALGSAVSALSEGGEGTPHAIPIRLDSATIVPADVPESHSIDNIIYQGAIIGLAGRTEMMVVSRSEPLQFEGWSVDRRAGRSSLAVYVNVAGSTYASRTGLPRDDVAEALNSVAVRDAGFVVDVPANALPLGVVALTFRAVSADGTQSYALEPAVEVKVVP